MCISMLLSIYRLLIRLKLLINHLKENTFYILLICDLDLNVSQCLIFLNKYINVYANK